MPRAATSASTSVSPTSDKRQRRRQRQPPQELRRGPSGARSIGRSALPCACGHGQGLDSAGGACHGRVRACAAGAAAGGGHGGLRRRAGRARRARPGGGRPGPAGPRDAGSGGGDAGGCRHRGRRHLRAARLEWRARGGCDWTVGICARRRGWRHPGRQRPRGRKPASAGANTEHSERRTPGTGRAGALAGHRDPVGSSSGRRRHRGHPRGRRVASGSIGTDYGRHSRSPAPPGGR